MSVRAIRILLHSAMYSGLCIHKQGWSRTAKNIFNNAFSQPSDYESFVLQNLKQDWDLLRTFMTRSMDEVSLMMHMIITKCVSIDKTMTGGGTEAGEVSGHLLTRSSHRDQWEEFMDKTLLAPFVVGECNDREVVSARLSTAYDRYGGDSAGDVAGAFAIELLEKVSLHSYSPNDRRVSAPGLWRMTRKFSYDDFLVSLQQIPRAAERYPLLSMLTSHDRGQLHALRYIPEVLEWFRLLHTRYSGRIDRETARVKTNAQAILEIAGNSASSFHKVDSVFRGYVAAFNNSWANVKRYGCIQFSSDFNQLVMSPDVAMSFSLPNEVDEGNCPLALAHYLIERHNAFVQTVDEAILLMRQRRNHVYSSDDTFTRMQVVSSKFVSSAHTIRCDIRCDFIPLLEKNCVVNGGGPGGSYDFAKAERLIIDRFLSDIPAIDMEMPGFTFMHEQHLQGGMAALRQKIKQESLAPDLVRSIERDINTPAKAQVLLELIEQVASFVSATGGTYVKNLSEDSANMLLVKYVKTVLLVEEDIGCRVIAQQVSARRRVRGGGYFVGRACLYVHLLVGPHILDGVG